MICAYTNGVVIDNIYLTYLFRLGIVIVSACVRWCKGVSEVVEYISVSKCVGTCHSSSKNDAMTVTD